MDLILASTSPRRRELLADAGFTFRVVASQAEELHDASINPDELCMLNAARKAQEVAARFPEALVVGADTLVFLDGEPLGKPADLAEARAMLRRLSGRTHHVRTGVALCQAGATETFAVTTAVTFQPLDEAAIGAYFTVVDPLDKAGGYAIQQSGNEIIREVDGSYSNVVGLPVAEVVDALRRRMPR